MTKKLFSTKDNRYKGLSKLIHTDVYESLNINAWGGLAYFITFIDDYLRYGYDYLLNRKSEVFEKFKEFWDEEEKQLDKNIKSLQFDQGGEYLSGDFNKYLLDNEIFS